MMMMKVKKAAKKVKKMMKAKKATKKVKKMMKGFGNMGRLKRGDLSKLMRGMGGGMKGMGL